LEPGKKGREEVGENVGKTGRKNERGNLGKEKGAGVNGAYLPLH